MSAAAATPPPKRDDRGTRTPPPPVDSSITTHLTPGAPSDKTSTGRYTSPRFNRVKYSAVRPRFERRTRASPIFRSVSLSVLFWARSPMFKSSPTRLRPVATVHDDRVFLFFFSPRTTLHLSVGQDVNSHRDSSSVIAGFSIDRNRRTVWWYTWRGLPEESYSIVGFDWTPDYIVLKSKLFFNNHS